MAIRNRFVWNQQGNRKILKQVTYRDAWITVARPGLGGLCREDITPGVGT
jgi:hypothetical protein